LRLIHHVPASERPALSKALFKAYWVEGRDVNNNSVLLKIAKEAGVAGADKLTETVFSDPEARKALETATADSISRGAFGVPGFWIPEAIWTNYNGEEKQGRFYWGQDRMHFVEAALLAVKRGSEAGALPSLRTLMPRCIGSNELPGRVRLQFWYDFSSPWAFLGWTQLERLQRTFGKNLEIEMKPFLLGALFRE
jgi:2-hydroxychromene-2-carboxylate isomerase